MSARIACAAVAVACALGCSTNVEIPRDVQLTCAAGGDCPSGFVCHAGRCQDAATLDTTPPDVTTVRVSPAEGRAGTTFTVEVEVTEDLATAPEMTLLLEAAARVPCAAGAAPRVFTCSYTATGTENGLYTGAVGIPHPFDLWMRDRAGNETTRSLLGSLLMDFNPPSAASASVVYRPAKANPLPTVSRAAAGTTVEVAVEADEPLDVHCAPADAAQSCALVADGPPGAAQLSFALVASDATSALFRATVPAGQPDGAYVPKLTWTDRVGNSSSAAIALSATAEVKTSAPTLAVDQGLVTYVRSPWGNAAAEKLGPGAGDFTIPAGPYFGLAPADPLSPGASLPATTFAIDAGAPAAVRVWSDAAGTSLLATVSPSADGTWVRARLQNVDTPSVWTTALDDAGNESRPVQIANVEWVATPRGAGSGGTLPRVDTSYYLTETLVPAIDTALPQPGSLAGLDGQTDVASAQLAIRRLASGPRPPARRFHGMAYDAARGRVVMFGGMDPLNTNLGDTWEWDGLAWSDRTPASGGPSPRSDMPLAYDSARGRIVLYGGSSPSSPRDTWEWDGTAWAQIPGATGGPGARSGHAMAYDSARSRVVLFGGREGPLDRVTWEWDGRSWTASPAPAAAAPPGRFGHSMAYDPVRGRVVLFGGRTDVYNSAFSDTWEFDGSAWTLVQPTGASPAARYDHRLVYDARRGRVVLSGGRAIVAGGQVARGDVWEWDGATWTEVTPSAGASPGTIEAHAAAYDVPSGRMVVFGGLNLSFSGALAVDRTWEWNGLAWSDRTPAPSPPAAIGNAMAFDEDRGRVVLFGGWSYAGVGSPWMNDVWEWDGTRWVHPTPSGTLPRGRMNHAMTYDPVERRVVVFGGSGYDPSLSYMYPKFNDVWDWDGTAWSERTTTSGPTPRKGAAMVYDPGRGAIVVFGGDASPDSNAGLVNETWELTPGATAGTWTWTQRALTPPSGLPRSAPRAFFNDGTRSLLLLGSYTAATAVWQWQGGTWSSVAISGSQPGSPPLGVWDGWRGRGAVFEIYQARVWDFTGSGFRQLLRPERSVWPANPAAAMAFDSVRGRTVLFDGDAITWEWDADVVATAQGTRQRRTPMMQLTASYRNAGFGPGDVTALRVRARAGGRFAATGAGAQLLGWRTGGAGAGGAALLPGQWDALAANADPVPLPASAGALSWAASAGDIPTFFAERDEELAFQLRPAGMSGPSDPESSIEADYIEVRVGYRAP